MGEWIIKCLSCKHCYFRKGDAEEMRCRCRNGKCNYEEVKTKNTRTQKER